mgnify:CR=1 FL=1
MQKFIFLAFLIALVPLNAQKKPQHKKKKPVVYEMPIMPPVEKSQPMGVIDRSVNHDHLGTFEDQAKCLDAFFEKDSIKRISLLKDLSIQDTANEFLEEYLAKYNDTCSKLKQTFFRPEHYKFNCRALVKSRFSEYDTMFVLDYTFDKNKYLEENKKKGKNSNIIIPCNITLHLEYVYKEVVYQNPYFPGCIQEKI